MHRFVVNEPIAGEDARIVLSPDESAHASRVLRMRPGDEVQLIDGACLWDAVIDTVDAKETIVRAIGRRPSPEPPCKAVLLQGLPKFDKLELIAQKGTELGMDALWPVEMERSVAKGDGKKQERLARIALEAAKQSGRARVPDIAPVMSFAKALEKAEEADLVLAAWEEEHALPLSRAVSAYVSEHGTPGKVIIVIGPEGGISPAEMAALEAAGAVSVTLGKRILRTETAGLCALSVLWTALGEM